jgi:AhpD family alkylhydroperoxidase
MSLTHHDKELVAVAISVAVGCRPCTSHHMAEARRAGAGDAALRAAVEAAVCVRGSATQGMRRHALDLAAEADGCGCAARDRPSELASLGASLAVNCTENIDKHLAAARRLGAGEDEIAAVLALVGKIREVAIGHAERRLASA